MLLFVKTAQTRIAQSSRTSNFNDDVQSKGGKCNLKPPDFRRMARVPQPADPALTTPKALGKGDPRNSLNPHGPIKGNFGRQDGAQRNGPPPTDRAGQSDILTIVKKAGDFFRHGNFSLPTTTIQIAGDDNNARRIGKTSSKLAAATALKINRVCKLFRQGCKKL